MSMHAYCTFIMKQGRQTKAKQMEKQTKVHWLAKQTLVMKMKLAHKKTL